MREDTDFEHKIIELTDNVVMRHDIGLGLKVESRVVSVAVSESSNNNLRMNEDGLFASGVPLDLQRVDRPIGDYQLVPYVDRNTGMVYVVAEERSEGEYGVIITKAPMDAFNSVDTSDNENIIYKTALSLDGGVYKASIDMNPIYTESQISNAFTYIYKVRSGTLVDIVSTDTQARLIDGDGPYSQEVSLEKREVVSGIESYKVSTRQKENPEYEDFVVHAGTEHETTAQRSYTQSSMLYGSMENTKQIEVSISNSYNTVAVAM